MPDLPEGTILDEFGDLEALTLDITVNLNLISVIASRLTQSILEIVGPIEGRWLYFTTNSMYPSEVNDPDLVDVSLGVRTTNSNNETFLWARAISDAAILVGTSVDIYLLSGTFATLPDESVDLYYRPLNCKYPPISSDVAVWNGTAYYLANDGWRSFTTGGGNPSLVSPNLDKLYQGISTYGYAAPNLKIVPGTVRFPVAIHNNKLWCCVTGTNRYEVFDFIRGYWRPAALGLGDITAVFASQDGYLLAFFGSDKTLRALEVPTTKLIDGSGQQSYSLLTVIHDGDAPHQRKDPYTLTLRCATGSDTIGFTTRVIIDNGEVDIIVPTSLRPGSIPVYASATDIFADLSTLVPIAKTYQLQINGTTPDFYLTDLTIDGGLRPLQLSSYRQVNTNFGSPNKKRLRVWPLLIDTLGTRVNFNFYVDGVLTSVANPTIQTPLLDSTGRTPGGLTHRVYIVTDVFGVDYGFTLTDLDSDSHGNPFLFEFFEAMTPDIVQVLPIARRFDQVGPQEFFKYGKIKQLEVRLLPFGGAVNTTSLLPYRVYFNDNSVQTGALTVANSVEASYYLGAFKGVSGQIVRIEIGPTDYDFHRYYMRALVLISGADTEGQWYPLGTS